MIRFQRRISILLTALAALVAAVSFVPLQSSAPQPRLPDLAGASEAAVSAIQREFTLAAADPDNAELRGNLASVLLAHQFDSAAAQEFEIASQLDPASFRWKYLQGLAETPRSRSRAMECFRAAVALRTDSWLPRLRLAELLLAENQLDPARELILDARQLAPNELRPALAEIRLSLLQQLPTPAVEVAEKLRGDGIRVRELSELYAAALFRLERTEAARMVVRELQDEGLESAGWNDPFAAAVLAFSTDPADVIAEARVLASVGNYQQAIARLQSARSRAVLHPDFYPTLARLLLENRQANDALQVTEEGLRATPGSPQLLHLRGSSLFILGQIQEAENCFREALRIKPDLALARLNLAHCLLQSSGRPAAIAALEETLRTAPEMQQARLLLTALLLDESRLTDAAVQLQSLQKMLPLDHPEVGKLQSRLTVQQSQATPSSGK